MYRHRGALHLLSAVIPTAGGILAATLLLSHPVAGPEGLLNIVASPARVQVEVGHTAPPDARGQTLDHEVERALGDALGLGAHDH